MSVGTRAAPAAPVAAKTVSPRRPGRPRILARALPLAPAVILLLLFLAGPIAYCAYIAFTDLQYDMGSAAAMAGAFVSLLVGVLFYRVFLRLSTYRAGPIPVKA